MMTAIRPTIAWVDAAVRQGSGVDGLAAGLQRMLEAALLVRLTRVIGTDRDLVLARNTRAAAEEFRASLSLCHCSLTRNLHMTHVLNFFFVMF